MMTRSKTYILILVATVLMVACTKDRPPTSSTNYDPNETHYYPDPAAVERYLYQPGTYWVYRDSTDGSRDSIWTAPPFYGEYHFNTDHGGPGGVVTPTTYYHFYRIPLLGAIHETNKFDIVGGGLFAYHLLPTAYYSFNGPLMAHYDSLMIQGAWYYDVFKRKAGAYTNYTHLINPNNKYYINDEFGILKKEIIGTDSAVRVYELVNANIVR